MPDTAHIIHDFSEPQPRAELRRMLNASVAAEAAQEISHYLADLKRRAVEAGVCEDWRTIFALVRDDGTATIVIGLRDFGGTGLHNAPMAEAIREAEALIRRNEVAEVNQTLGLDASGRYAGSAA